MTSRLMGKLERVPRGLIRRLARTLASAPAISDAACPTFPSVSRDFLSSHGYHSQIGQDYVVDQILLGALENGVFVDVGAHDGVEFSNTFFFEAVRGWTGLCIEPNPEVYESLITNRKCHTEQVAVGASEGTVDFTAIRGPDMLSGLNANFNRRHRRRIKSAILEATGSHQVIQVPLRPLQSLLDFHCITHIDLLTIDTEGSELEVLKGINFQTTQVSCIVIERNYESGRIPKLLKSNGFTRLMALAWDDIYIRNDLRLRVPLFSDSQK